MLSSSAWAQRGDQREKCPTVVVAEVGSKTAWLVDKDQFAKADATSPHPQDYLLGQIVPIKTVKILKGTLPKNGELWLLLSDASLSFHGYESPAKVGKLQVLFLEDVQLRPSSSELKRLTQSAATRQYQVLDDTPVDLQLKNVKQVCGGAESVIPVSSSDEDRVKKIEKSLKTRKRQH